MENKSAISSDLIRGHIDTIILYSLFEEDKFAQMISDHVKEKSGDQYEINQATLYSSLKRLESLKYIKGYWKYADVGRRRYFTLTDLGRSVVNENLNSWNFSRAIIDKLMDNTPETIVKTETVVKTEYVDRIVEVPVPQTNAETPNIPSTNTAQPTNTSLPNENVGNSPINSSPILSQDATSGISNTAENTETTSPIPSTQEKQEINFRNILQGLIKVTTIKKTAQKPNPDLNEESDDVLHADSPEVLDFNETISSTAYNKKNSNNGKIDYGDLTLQAAKEGYKIRISSKDVKITEGSLFIHRLNFVTSLIIFLLLLIEILVLNVAFKGLISTALSISLSALVIIPIVFFIIRLKKPYKTSKQLKPDSIYTSLIVFFNLLLITFAINLLFNVDFNNLNVILSSFIVPIIIYVDFVLFFVLRFLLCKTTFFANKKGK